MHLMPLDACDVGSIVGIDPGTETLGLACIKFSVSSLRIVGTSAHTFTGSKLGMNQWIAAIHSNRYSRLQAHRMNLIFQFNHYQPNIIVCESSFFNPRRPNAFSALVEVLDTVRDAVLAYDNTLALHLIDPPSVKKAVGASGASGKESVKEAVLKLTDELQYQGDICLDQLSEHAIDAIAVAYSKLNEYRRRG
jgi:Holliday junction resolvasome RuvABC endonuclease subunit